MIIDTIYIYLTEWGVNILAAIAIILIGRYLSRFILSVFKKFLDASKLDEMLVEFVVSITKYLLYLLIAIAALQKLGVDTTSFIALLGAAGLAIGLALQNSLQNFAAGVLLLVFRPFKQGDYINAAGTAGSVEKIKMFSTTLKTPDNCEVTVPNGAVYSSTITNFSARETRRVEITVGISYEDDLLKAKEVLQEILKNDERVLEEPDSLVAVKELADSSVNIVIRAWTASSSYWALKFDLNERIKLALDEAGITIPYPQMTVHMNSK